MAANDNIIASCQSAPPVPGAGVPWRLREAGLHGIALLIVEKHAHASWPHRLYRRMQSRAPAKCAGALVPDAGELNGPAASIMA